MIGLALDLATFTGCAVGAPGEAPKFFSWDLAAKLPGEERPTAKRAERFARLLTLTSNYLARHPEITDVITEEPLHIAAAYQAHTSDEAYSFLRGAIGIVEAVAHARGIDSIWHFPVNTVRMTLMDRARFPKGEVKGYVLTHIRARAGWTPSNTDEADAGALWNHWQHIKAPRAAIATVPALLPELPLPQKRRNPDDRDSARGRGPATGRR